METALGDDNFADDTFCNLVGSITLPVADDRVLLVSLGSPAQHRRHDAWRSLIGTAAMLSARDGVEAHFLNAWLDLAVGLASGLHLVRDFRGPGRQGGRRW